MLRPAVALYISDTTGNPVLVGTIVSIQAFLPLLIAMPVGSLIDRLGFHLSSALGAMGMFAAGWLYLGSPGLYGIASAQILEGVGELFVWTALQASASRLGESEEGNKQEQYIGYFTLVVAAGQFLGPLTTGTLLANYSYKAVFRTFLVIVIALGAFSWGKWIRNRTRAEAGPEQTGLKQTKGSADREQSKASPMTIARNPLVLASLLSSFSMLFITGVYTSFFPILLRDHLGYTEFAIGLFLALRTAGAFVIRPMIAVVLGRFGHEKTLQWSTALAVTVLLLVPVARNSTALAVTMFVGGLAMGLNNPLTMLVIAKHTSVSQRGLGMGMRLFVNRAAHVLSPLLFGGIAGAMGLQSGFYASGGFLAIVVMQIRKLSRNAGKSEEKGKAKIADG